VLLALAVLLLLLLPQLVAAMMLAGARVPVLRASRQHAQLRRQWQHSSLQVRRSNRTANAAECLLVMQGLSGCLCCVPAYTGAAHCYICLLLLLLSYLHRTLAAPPEGSLEQQWPQLDGAADVLALAPDDEILGELLALQVGTISRSVAVLPALLDICLVQGNLLPRSASLHAHECAGGHQAQQQKPGCAGSCLEPWCCARQPCTGTAAAHAHVLQAEVQYSSETMSLFWLTCCVQCASCML
jgi:hypothetical protein